jgi:SET domain-containing protein
VPHGGQGLYAKKEFKAGQKIAEYSGKKLTAAQVDKKYPGDTLAPYVYKASANNYIDAKKTNSGLARYANDCRPQNRASKHCAGNNARLRPAPGGKASLKAIKKIRPGQEIYTSYGPTYWRAGGSKR